MTAFLFSIVRVGSGGLSAGCCIHYGRVEMDQKLLPSPKMQCGVLKAVRYWEQVFELLLAVVSVLRSLFFLSRAFPAWCVKSVEVLWALLWWWFCILRIPIQKYLLGFGMLCICVCSLLLLFGSKVYDQLFLFGWCLKSGNCFIHQSKQEWIADL